MAHPRRAMHRASLRRRRRARPSRRRSHAFRPRGATSWTCVPARWRSEQAVGAELRAGRAPSSLIMSALRERQPDGAFAVRAVFEPVPLYAVMAKQGLAHHTERLADDDWRVWFYPAQEDAA